MALTPLAPRLRDYRVVMASASPRRKEILALAGVTFDVIPSSFEEPAPAGAASRAEDYARDMAVGKAVEVATREDEADAENPRLVIGADTVVEVDGVILGKPVDKEDAERMLRRLSGRRHRVITGVAVIIAGGGRDPQVLCEFQEETHVTFSELSEALVREYVDTGEPADKAGGYGIQARGAMLVEHVDGDVLNAAGFPLNRFCREVARALPVGK